MDTKNVLSQGMQDCVLELPKQLLQPEKEKKFEVVHVNVKGEDEMSERGIPIWEKYVLSTEEASAYFHIGINRLRRMIQEKPTSDWILWTGTHAGIKRGKFERMIDATSAI